MVSEYHNHVQALAELDQIFERDWRAAAMVAELLLAQQGTPTIHKVLVESIRLPPFD